MANIVAIVGRPNVGKSTLFNRLVEAREAIMDNVSGVTRDRHYGQSEWSGKRFTVIDTGGYVVGSDDVFEESIREQVELAIEEAGVILFVVDVQSGLTDLDKDFAQVLRRSKKPIYLVANKADDALKSHLAGEFYALGMESDIWSVSAISGSGTGDLLDAISTHFETSDEEEEPPTLPRITIVGRPNVGKSSLVNLLLNEKRSIVTDIAGTTRDAVDSEYKYFGQHFILTDTAGIRRKTRVKENIEFYSVLRSIRAIESADVCILMLDASLGFEAQDMNILHLANRYHKGMVIMVNKWDLVEKSTNTARDYEAAIRERLGTLSFIPIIFASVHEKQRVMKVVEKAIEVYESRIRKVPTSALNDALLPEIEHYPPPAHRGHYIRIKYITQLPTRTVTFAFFCNHPKYLKNDYARFLENKIRHHFGFEGVPINIVFREK